MSQTQTDNLTPFSRVVEAYGAGRPIVIVDAEDRENEGDICVATQHITPELIAFMMREARGLICVSLDREVARRLNLPLQTTNNNSPFQTPFAVSVDLREVADSGVTASGRAKTLRALINPELAASDFVSPGHVLPLIAHPAGVVGRAGQTEGSYDMARLAGLSPSGVICEILAPNGEMLRGPALTEFAQRFELPMTSVAEILRQRTKTEILLRQVVAANLETDFGVFEVIVFEDDVDGKEHLALVYGGLDACLREDSLLVRIHSECLTGDVFGSERCDCGAQLRSSLNQIRQAGHGLVLYLRQEGRGIGLSNKVKAYALQDLGHDTVEANIRLGFEPDLREFRIAAKILSLLGIRRVKLLTNNPDKIADLEEFGLKVVSREPLIIPPSQHSKAYLATKRDKLGHLL